ncbi:MAG TPA: carbohydrate kinase family protein [Candidatus Acidoferrum sp.]|nr:carbohydrate kinase family protein [Candidatus Acidoferrum sp.]
MRRKKESSLENLLVFGDINVDVIGRVASWPEPGGECLSPQLELHCGGVAANTALALSPWKIKTRLIGCVGQDEFGDLLLHTLRKSGVDILHIQRTPQALTGLLYINVTPDGQRTFFGSRGANRLTRPARIPSSLVHHCAAAHLVGYSFLDAGPEKTARQIMRAFKTRGKWVSFDIGMEPSQKIPEKILRLLPQIDLLFLSNEESFALTGVRDAHKSFLNLQRTGAHEIVMKLGKRGCLISDKGVLPEVPSFPVRTVDSTGAGDAFNAAFLQARLRGWPTPEAALLANAAGAAAASRVGAGTTLSELAQIIRLLRNQPLKKPWEEARLRILSRLRTIPGL